MITLRDYQGEAVQSPFDYYASGRTGNPLIAMPTGTGKSIVIAEFCRRVLAYWPNQRIVVATHVKELVEQNARKMLEVWPTAPVGIYSAGLGSRDCMQSIIFGLMDLALRWKQEQDADKSAQTSRQVVPTNEG